MSQVVSIQRLLEESGFVEVVRSFASVTEGTGEGGGAGNCYEDDPLNCTNGGAQFFCGRDKYSSDIQTILRRFFSTSNNTENADSSQSSRDSNGVFV